MLLEVIVPAYNEATRLPGGLDLLTRKLVELEVPAAILVVDNASTDATAQLVRDWSGPVPVRLLHCPQRGKGAAVRTGLLATTAPYVGFCDADMATDLRVLGEVLTLLGSGRHVVVGSRRHPDSLVRTSHNPLRRLGAIMFNRLCRGLVGGITDTQCGFKFFAGPLARAVAADLRTTGFAFDVELLLHCRRHGAEPHDVAVRWQDVSGSTFSVRRHSLGCLRDLARIGLIARRYSGRAGRPASVPLKASAALRVDLPYEQFTEVGRYRAG
ncbi:glycosyltransferase [Actinomadura scrupuli]|uniref:glycosyltransferase n=1 Tax=Actinomadura scrupuli TaxID=559629 RepID=UPI003D98D4C5